MAVAGNIVIVCFPPSPSSNFSFLASDDTTESTKASLPRHTASYRYRSPAGPSDALGDVTDWVRIITHQLKKRCAGKSVDGKSRRVRNAVGARSGVLDT